MYVKGFDVAPLKRPKMSHVCGENQVILFRCSPVWCFDQKEIQEDALLTAEKQERE